MPESDGKGVSNFHRLWQRFKDRLVQDAPEDIQLCEFDCRELECATGDWEKCERRLRSIEDTRKYT